MCADGGVFGVSAECSCCCAKEAGPSDGRPFHRGFVTRLLSRSSERFAGNVKRTKETERAVRWALTGVCGLSSALFAGLFLLLDEPAYLRCDLRRAPTIRTAALLNVSVTHHYNSRSYHIHLSQTDPPISARVICAGGICGWLEEVGHWPQSAQLALSTCGDFEGKPMHVITEVEVNGRQYPVGSAAEQQRTVFKYSLALLVASVALAILSAIRVRRLRRIDAQTHMAPRQLS